MRPPRLLSFALGVFLLPALVSAADLQISCQKKAAEAVRGKAAEGRIAKGEDQVVYTIAVNNTSSKDTGPLEVRYILMVERQTVGEKRGAVHIDRVRGSAKLEPIKARQRGTVDTEPVKLEHSALQGDFIYTDGGKIKAKDSVKGYWVRVYQGETMVAEFSNPSTIATREKWGQASDEAATEIQR